MPVWVVKALEVGPGVVISVVALTLAAAPGPLAAGAALVLAGVVGAAGHRAWEGPVAATISGARRPRPSERDDLAAVLTPLCQVGLGPPLVEVRVKRSRRIGAMGAGRRRRERLRGVHRGLGNGGRARTTDLPDPRPTARRDRGRALPRLHRSSDPPGPSTFKL